MSAASLDKVRAIADAVLYEGYLLYPYRASSSKNQSRWQFGVLGPPIASAASYGEDPAMSVQCLLEPGAGIGSVTVHLRFLQLQTRVVEQRTDVGFRPVAELVVDGRSLLSWDEAIECEIELPAYKLASASLAAGSATVTTVDVPGGEDIETVVDASGAVAGRIVRRRAALRADVSIGAEPDGGLVRLLVEVTNTHPDPADGKDSAIRLSLIGTHVLIVAEGAGFVSLLEPPDEAAAAVELCRQRRAYPVLVGERGSTDIVLGSPIILYDYPEIAEQSAGALFDSTEIDEILTLRVMTMTEAEKAEARATDPRAAAIIDRCDQMSPESLRDLHGVLRDPHRPGGEVPWWDPASDEGFQPDTDSVVIDGVSVSKGSLVRVHPSRRADAQDLFFAEQVARVTAVLSDVDGDTHVAVVLVDDPAADMHEWYGRYFYFGPEELEPLDQAREESRS
ncbi:hypothetical protein [Nocardioides sp.]|uniref:hypothetical protein n=1 Tax=Nocardioides sp. TaxID=35761 RepID=UPI0031FE56D6|nr:hypothetical protein [Nocardioides sp.]